MLTAFFMFMLSQMVTLASSNAVALYLHCICHMEGEFFFYSIITKSESIVSVLGCENKAVIEL